MRFPTQEEISDEWAEKVGTVFSVQPRIAVDENVYWIKRLEEKKFRTSVISPGNVVCLYGPSGSGKTSLAKSIVARLTESDRRFVYTRLNHNSDWEKFKSQIVENKSRKNSDWKIGVKNLLPYAEISGEIHTNDASRRAEMISTLDIPEIARVLIDLDATLVIDDVNFASDGLLEMLTSLSKEMLDTAEDTSAKIVFIGADNIYSRIIETNDSLKERTDEIALGSIRGQDDSDSTIRDDKVWDFICNGLVALELNDPRTDRFFKKEEREMAKQWIEWAADGLPKSIVMLGKKIAEQGEARKRVSFADFRKASSDMIRRNFRHYRSRYRTLFSLIRRDKLSAEVVMWMFSNGASGIHSLEQISEDLRESGTYADFGDAIITLAAKGFLVVTGADDNVFFARDPLLSHTIGVVIANPELVGSDRKYFVNDENARQLRLQFYSHREPESRTKI